MTREERGALWIEMAREERPYVHGIVLVTAPMREDSKMQVVSARCLHTGIGEPDYRLADERNSRGIIYG